MATMLNRSKDNPWKLKTPPGTSEYTMHTDPPPRMFPGDIDWN